MRKKINLKLTVIFLSLMVASVYLFGCATMSDVIRAKQEGTEGIEKEYPVGFDQAWKISKSVLRWERAGVIEENRSEGYMLTSIDTTYFTMGANIGVWITSIDQDHTNVLVITKRKMQTNIATPLSEETFHKRFEQAVEIIKGGGKLPISPPD